MYDLEHAAHITEAVAMDVIFSACRANETRATVQRVTLDGQQCRVSFMRTANGDHQATVRDANAFVIALAVVDQFDC